MAEPSADSATIRTQMRRRRAALAPEEIREASARIVRRLEPLLPHGALIGLYAATQGEPDLALLEALRPDLRLAWPRANARDHSMTFHQARRAELKEGLWGIFEPEGGEIMAPQDFDAMIIPGTAFTPQGARLGMGGGFYDRFLPALNPGALRIGVAYHWQVIEQLQQHPHDMRMTHVVTDTDVWHACRSPLEG